MKKSKTCSTYCLIVNYTGKRKLTNEAGVGVIGIINRTLEKVLVEPANIVVSLDLTAHVMAIQGKGADMLADLLHWGQCLQN